MPFQRLLIWQKGIDLVDFMYGLTKEYPLEERYGLISQTQRAAVSVPSNIAEGSQRGTPKDFRNFLMIAKGSLAELYTQGIIALRRGYLSDASFHDMHRRINELDKMLHAFILKLR